MSKIADQVYDQLRNGASPTNVRRLAHSGSQYTLGLQRYLEWASKETVSVQKQIDSLRTSKTEFEALVKRLQFHNNDLNKKVEHLTYQQENLNSKIAEKTTELQTLISQIGDSEFSLNGLRLEIQRLQGKGYTDEIILKLSKTDAASGGEMLQRVETLEKYEVEYKKLQQIRADYEQLGVKFQTIQKELDKVDERLGKRREEEILYEASVKIVQSIIQHYNFSNRDFEILFGLIEKVGIRGMPSRTLSAVKQTLAKHRTLKKLDAAVIGRQKALNKAEIELAKIEERLEATPKMFTTLSKTIEKLIINIQDTAVNVENSAKTSLSKIVKDAEESITILMNQTVEIGKAMGKLEALAPLLKLIEETEGQRSQVYPAILLISQRFLSWLQKREPLNYTMNTAVTYFINTINTEMGR